MSTSEDAAFKQVKKGVVKRSQKRVVGIFIDGVGLDRAAKRLNKRIDFSGLVKGVSGGIEPAVSRYYTIIPYEDDSRQHAFFDAVHRAGLDIVLKRLPPKGVERQAAVEIELSADIIAFTCGHSKFSSELLYLPEEHKAILAKMMPDGEEPRAETGPSNEKRIVIAVCPSRELSYALTLARELGADTVTADFAARASGNVLKSAAKFIDLSDSTTIWKE